MARRAIVWICLLIVATIFSPYITPPATIGPQGTRHLAQMLIAPLLIAYISIKYRKSLMISVDGVTLIATLIFASITISAITGVFVRGYSWRLGDFYEPVQWLFYVMLLALIPPLVNKKTISKGILFILITIIVAGFLGLLQYIDLTIINQYITPYYSERDPTHRVFGTEESPNIFAQLISAGLILAIGLFYATYIKERQVTKKALLLSINIAFLLVVLLLTESRSVIIGVVCGLSVTFAILYAGEVGEKSQIISYVTLIFVAGFLVFLGAITIGVGDRFLELLYIQESNLFRIRIPESVAILPILSEAILIGHGPSIEGMAQFRDEWGYLHSGLLTWAYHYGIVGVFLMIIFILSLCKVGIQILLNERLLNNSPVIWAGAFSVVGLSVSLLAMWPIRDFSNRRVFFLLMLLYILIISAMFERQKLSV